MTRNPARADATHHDRRPQTRKSPVPTSLVLLVERELASRLARANELLDQGYDIVESESASEAMNILRGRNDFDAMVADIDPEHVPGGLALIRYAASRHPLMKILISSAESESRVESEGFVADFLPTPLRNGDLARHLRKLLKPGAADAFLAPAIA